MALLGLFAICATVAAAAPTGTAGQLRVAIDSASSTADFSGTAARGQFVILQEWERAKMRSLKAANPAIKVLMYKNLSFMAPAASSGASTGVTIAEADANPSWYLKNTSGEKFSPWNYDWMSAADIGDPSYQQRWAGNVLTTLERDGWDGVFVDDTNPSIGNSYDVDAVAKYPTDAAYSKATGSALATIGPKLRAAGKLVIPNFGDWRLNREVVDGWLDDVSGGMEEQFTKWGSSTSTGYLPTTDWKLQLGALKSATAKGKYYLGVAHSAGTDASAARYGWATMLLGAGGRASFSLAADYTNETWFPEYGYAIGEPVGEETAAADGVHRRRFSTGLVLVNPTGAPVAVDFGGTYSGSGLTRATRAVLAPSSALVLTRDAGTVLAEAATPASSTTVVTTTTTPTPASGNTGAPGLASVAAVAPEVAPAALGTAPAATPVTTTKTTSTKPRGARTAVKRVEVRKSLKASAARTARMRATCPGSVRSCKVVVRVEVRQAGLVKARGARSFSLRGGSGRTVTVRLVAARRA